MQKKEEEQLMKIKNLESEYRQQRNKMYRDLEEEKQEMRLKIQREMEEYKSKEMKVYTFLEIITKFRKLKKIWKRKERKWKN